MRFAYIAALLLTIGISGAGCGGSEAVSSAPVLTPEAQQSPDSRGEPQPRLPTIKLWLGSEELVTEQALREEERRAGMMFRKSMPENEAMLFVFPYPAQVSFWMRNTYVPLSCAFIDSDGIIREIRDMKPLDETPIASKSDRIVYVLETNQGWFERHNITVGTAVRTEKGSLRETYAGRAR